MFSASVTCFFFCFGTVEQPKQIPLSDFCQRYERQVLTQKDLAEIKKLPRELRDRMQGNDLDYLCLCKRWNNPACSSTLK